MKKQLIEISKGTVKGLLATLCSASIFGLPAADGLYSSIETKQGQIAYKVAFGVAISSAIAGASALVYSLRK